MPEENINQQAPVPGSDNPGEGSPTPDPEPAIRFASADTIAQSGPGLEVPADDDASGQVPSFRLREESARRREAENAAVMLQQQNQLLHNQIAAAQQQQPTPAPDSAVDDLQRPFGNDPDGQQAYQAVRGVSEHIAKQTVDDLRDEIRQDLQGEFDQKLGTVTASMQMAEELAGMKARGLIDDTAEKEIGRRMGEQIRQNSAWGQQENQHHLLNKVWTDMLRQGEIKPTTRPATPSGNGTNPLQPGAPRLTDQQLADNNDGQLREIQARFPNRFRGMSIEQLRELGGPMVTQSAQQAQPQEQTQAVPQRTYTHTRE